MSRSLCGCAILLGFRRPVSLRMLWRWAAWSPACWRRLILRATWLPLRFWVAVGAWLGRGMIHPRTNQPSFRNHDAALADVRLGHRVERRRTPVPMSSRAPGWCAHSEAGFVLQNLDGQRSIFVRPWGRWPSLLRPHQLSGCVPTPYGESGLGVRSRCPSSALGAWFSSYGSGTRTPERLRSWPNSTTSSR
jgi:hypothetical protein